MRYALGLDVAPAASFAAVVALDTSAARPRELPISPAPVPAHDASIVDATVAAIALATRREGEPPSAITLVHPLSWDGRRVQRLRRALREAGVPDILLQDAATAAAVASDAAHPIASGEVVVVVALRPGGAQVIALRKDDAHRFHTLGAPLPVDGVEEGQLDDALLHLVAAQLEGGLPATTDADAALLTALDRLNAAVRVARERLNDDESTVIGVRLPGHATLVSIERVSFQDAVAELIRPIVPALAAAIAAAVGVAAPAAVLIMGTAGPAPLLAELLGADSETPVLVADARHGGAFGAALLAASTVPVVAVVAVAEPATVVEAEIETEPESEPAALTPVAAVAHVNAATEPPERRRRRPLIVVLLPVAAAAAALVVLGGAAATGALDLTPTSTSTHEPSVPAAPDSGATGSATTTPSDEGSAKPAPPANAAQPGQTSDKKKTSNGSGAGASSPSTPDQQPAPSPSQSTDPPTDPPTTPATDPPTTPATDPPTTPATDPPTTPADPPTTPATP